MSTDEPVIEHGKQIVFTYPTAKVIYEVDTATWLLAPGDTWVADEEEDDFGSAYGEIILKEAGEEFQSICHFGVALPKEELEHLESLIQGRDFV